MRVIAFLFKGTQGLEFCETQVENQISLGLKPLLGAFSVIET